jgi:hypothetical protein
VCPDEDTRKRWVLALNLVVRLKSMRKANGLRAPHGPCASHSQPCRGIPQPLEGLLSPLRRTHTRTACVQMSPAPASRAVPDDFCADCPGHGGPVHKPSGQSTCLGVLLSRRLARPASRPLDRCSRAMRRPNARIQPLSSVEVAFALWGIGLDGVRRARDPPPRQGARLTCC